MRYQFERAYDVVRTLASHHKADLAGWFGMCLIHGATLPVSLRAIFGNAGTLPPLEMVLMIWSGLVLFLLNAIAKRNTLYIVSNGVGFALQTLLLTIIVFRG